MASQRADSSGGPVMKKPRVEAASWSFIDDQPNIQYDHAVSIGNFSRKMKMPSGKFLSSGIFSFNIVKLREREGQGVDPGRSLKGHLWMVDGGYPFPDALH